MKLNLRTKAAIVLVAFGIAVAGACGARAWADYDQARIEAEMAAEQAQIEAETGEFTVSAITDEAVALLGGQDAADELSRKVGTWCYENVEGATHAEWDQKVSCDFKAGSFDFGYALDDEKSTKVTVRAYPGAGRYIVSKAVE